NADIDDLSLENPPPLKKQAGGVGNRPEPKKVDSASPVSKNDSVPTTPRHRDHNGKIAITPRHRALMGLAGTPQSLRTPTTPRFFPSVYADARRLFRGSAQSAKVIGRENEKEELTTFISKRFKTKSSGCVYISGPPGTGKSALVTEILHELQETFIVQTSYCNCMSIKNVNDIYAKLFDDFGAADVLQGDETAGLKKIFHSKTQSHFIILDEIDHLLDVDLDLLYQLFEWSLKKTSSLVLVGIANALDLTDRFLPRLKAKNLKPHLIPFMPYSVKEISSIITSKLNTLMPVNETEPSTHVPFIHPTAIQFLAKKVAAQTGDIRKAFAIALRAIDLIETETQTSLSKSAGEMSPSISPSPSKTPLSENIFLSSPTKTKSPRKHTPVKNPMALLTVANAPRVTIAHMARVTATAFSNGLTQRLAALNLQQKAALCALSALEGRLRDDANMPQTPSKKTLAPTLRALFTAYAKLCKHDNVIAPLTACEFRDVLVGLETLSLVSWVDGKTGSLGAAAGVSTPSRRGRGKATGGMDSEGMENQKIASTIGVKELKASLNGAGSDILLALMDGYAL
ncbi:cell division control protein Cdc6, partial [Microthyrium microscopicum]